jgi:hypothetical protein
MNTQHGCGVFQGSVGLNHKLFSISGTYVYNTVPQKLDVPNDKVLLVTEQVNAEAVPYICTPAALVPKIGD